MIKKQDVVRLLVPFPDINSGLASARHMYICHKVVESETDLIKCQSYKNKYFITKKLKHKVIEAANIQRNPFNHTSLIDCDKLFRFENVCIPEKLLTKNRRDVCSDLFNNVENELLADGYSTPDVSPKKLIAINSL